MYDRMTVKRMAKKCVEHQEGNRSCVISFSGGKDSVAMFLALYETGEFDKWLLYHYYFVPGMSFVDEYMALFEKLTGVKVVQIPGEPFLKTMNAACYQEPWTAAGYDEMAANEENWMLMSAFQLSRTMRYSYGVPECYDALGLKKVDSPNRKGAMEKCKGFNHAKKYWYPAMDMTDEDCYRIMRRYGIPLSREYALFGNTFDGLQYRFLKIIKDEAPEDWKRVLEWYPMAELVILKHEHYYGGKLWRGRGYGKTTV